MVFVIFDLTEDIEKEDAHILMKILMVKEEFGEEGEVFTVDWVLIPINLEHSHCVFFISVDFISRRMEQWTTLTVTF